MVLSSTGWPVFSFLTPKLCCQEISPPRTRAIERPGTSPAFISLGMSACSLAAEVDGDGSELGGLASAYLTTRVDASVRTPKAKMREYMNLELSAVNTIGL